MANDLFPPRVAILREAERLVSGPRAEDYGDAVQTHNDVAAMFNVLKGAGLAGSDVALLLLCVKMVRAQRSPHLKDNYADMCGYAAIQWECALDETDA